MGGRSTLSFGAALRRVLRQDPMLLGEIRDMETLDTALKAAGHLVFSTLHTTDATQTINRVISFYPPHQHQEIRALLHGASAVVSFPAGAAEDGRGRVPAASSIRRQ